MADLDTAIDYLMNTLISNVSGINLAPSHPIESAPEFPVALAFPLRGTASTANINRSKNLPIIRIAVHVSRGQGLAAASQQIRPLLDRIIDVLLNKDNATWGGNIDTILSSDDRPIVWEYGPSNIGNVQTHGWFIDVEIKYHRSIS